MTTDTLFQISHRTPNTAPWWTAIAAFTALDGALAGILKQPVAQLAGQLPAVPNQEELALALRHLLPLRPPHQLLSYHVHPQEISFGFRHDAIVLLRSVRLPIWEFTVTGDCPHTVCHTAQALESDLIMPNGVLWQMIKPLEEPPRRLSELGALFRRTADAV